jgi:FkbM family methyltransferase
LGTILVGVRNAADGVFLGLGRPPLRIEFDGLYLGGWLRHRSFLQGLVARPYELLARRLFCAALEPGVTVIDGGAHIGLYSLTAARALGESATIIAFEPDPYNRQALAINLARNGLANVWISPCALADVPGKAVFHVNDGTLGSSLVARNWSDLGGARDVVVKTTSLDHELDRLSVERVVVKLDVEGAEPLVLRGMRGLFRRAKSLTLIVELNAGALMGDPASGRSGPAHLLADLDEVGFDIHFIDESRETLIPRMDIDPARKGNLWCVLERK